MRATHFSSLAIFLALGSEHRLSKAPLKPLIGNVAVTPDGTLTPERPSKRPTC